MGQVSVTQLRCAIGSTVSQAEFGQRRTVICRRGQPVAAIVSYADYEALEALEERLIDEGLVEEARERQKAARPLISLEELKAKVGL